MKKDKRYLISEKDKGMLREWKCAEVSENAYKVEDLVNASSYNIFSTVRTDNPFWVLKTEVTGEVFHWKLVSRNMI